MVIIYSHINLGQTLSGISVNHRIINCHNNNQQSSKNSDIGQEMDNNNNQQLPKNNDISQETNNDENTKKKR
jgi:hypothetical protein